MTRDFTHLLRKFSFEGWFILAFLGIGLALLLLYRYPDGFRSQG